MASITQNDKRKAQVLLTKVQERSSNKKIEVRINEKTVIYTDDKKKVAGIIARYSYLNDNDLKNALRE